MKPNIKSVNPKNYHAGMAFLHEEADCHNHTDEKKEYGAEDRYLTGEFIIVAKFGGYSLHHLTSRLANVIR